MTQESQNIMSSYLNVDVVVKNELNRPINIEE